MPYRGRSYSRGRGNNRGRGRGRGRGQGPYRQHPTPATTDISSVLNSLVRSVQSIFGGRDTSSNRGGYGGRGREPRPHPGAFQRHPRYNQSSYTDEAPRYSHTSRQTRQDNRPQARSNAGNPHPTRSDYETQPAHQPGDQSRAAQINSDNPDFRELIKTVNQGARLYHAQNNWDRLPTTVDKAIDRIATSVRPPMPDESLKRQITRAADQFKNAIRHTVTEHLVRKTAQTHRTMNQLDQTDLHQARAIARKQLLRTNTRMNSARADHLLDNMANNVTDPNPPWTTSTRGTRRGTASHEDAPITTRNRFQVLQEEEDDRPLMSDENIEDESDTEPEPLPQRTARRKARSPTEVRDTPKKSRLGNYQFAIPTTVVPKPPVGSVGPQPASAHSGEVPTTSSAAPTTPVTPAHPPTPYTTPTMQPNLMPRLSLFHGDRKQLWSLPEIRDDEDVILVADSNGKNLARFTPPNWRVACYSGATFRHARDLIQRSPIPTQIKRIVFAVGINDRTNPSPPTVNAVTQLRDALMTRQRPATFLAVPHFENEPQDLATGATEINLTLGDLFGDDFITLPTDFYATRLRQDDFYHYSTGTAHDMVSIVSSAVDALN